MRLRARLGIMLVFSLVCVLLAWSNIRCGVSYQPLATGWTQTYGGTSDDMAYSVIQTSDGDYAIAGPTYSFGAGLSDFWLVKVDDAGNVQWNKTYGDTGDEYPVTLIHTEDGGYALAGSGWLVKTDANGDMIWNRTYLTDSCNCNVEYVVQTGDGGYALAGNTRIYGDDDFCLIRTDCEGKVLWNKTYTRISKDGVFSLIQTTDEGYALAGYTDGQIGSRPRFYLVKTDANGNRLWNHTFGTGNGHYVAYSVAQTNDGGYALAGDNSTWIGGSLMTRHCYFVLVDSEGNLEQEEEYGGTNVTAAYSVVQTYDNGFALVGYKASSVTGSRDCYLVKTDVSGAVLWENTYGGELDDIMRSVVQTYDGGYTLVGQTRSFGAGGWDFWLVRTDENGVVPESPSIILLPLFMTAALLAAVLRQKGDIPRGMRSDSNFGPDVSPRQFLRVFSVQCLPESMRDQ